MQTNLKNILSYFWYPDSKF